MTFHKDRIYLLLKVKMCRVGLVIKRLFVDFIGSGFYFNDILKQEYYCNQCSGTIYLNQFRQ